MVVASLWTSIAVAPVAAADPTPPAPFLGEQGVDGSGGTTKAAPRRLAPTGFQDTVVFNGLTNTDRACGSHRMGGSSSLRNPA